MVDRRFDKWLARQWARSRCALAKWPLSFCRSLRTTDLIRSPPLLRDDDNTPSAESREWDGGDVDAIDASIPGGDVDKAEERMCECCLACACAAYDADAVSWGDA